MNCSSNIYLSMSICIEMSWAMFRNLADERDEDTYDSFVIPLSTKSHVDENTLSPNTRISPQTSCAKDSRTPSSFGQSPWCGAHAVQG
jgi:hypothetical protein